ncbi:MAG: hypothetical protein ACR2FN_05640 [Chitinophagaceae bacterium]
MITKEEEDFLKYWENNRDREKKPSRQLMAGLPWGLILGLGIQISLSTGDWYQRAMMVADAEVNPLVISFAILIIVVFVSLFYKKHQWEMNDQRYKEILYKKSKQELNT